jgi:hypothetical protein
MRLSGTSGSLRFSKPISLQWAFIAKLNQSVTSCHVRGKFIAPGR